MGFPSPLCFHLSQHLPHGLADLSPPLTSDNLGAWMVAHLPGEPHALLVPREFLDRSHIDKRLLNEGKSSLFSVGLTHKSR